MDSEKQRPSRPIINRPPAPGPMPELKWHERLNVLNVTVLIFLLAALYSLPVLRGSDRQIDYLGNLIRFAGYFFPPDFSITRQTLVALRETFQIAVMATLFSIVLSIPLAIAGAQTMAPRWLVAMARMTMNGIRTIPGLIWAVIAVAIVGANSLAGVIALTFYSMGYLGKFFSDTFEAVDFEVAKGLRAIGADAVQSFTHGVWPHAKPFVWSHGLWMLEYNIRSAAIIGYVGAGGLGVWLHQYTVHREWEKLATVLLFIFVLVTLLDLLGEWIRKKIARRAGARPLPSTGH